MFSTKIITCGTGLLLLLPLAAVFWLMAVHRGQSEVEMRKSMEKALADSKAHLKELAGAETQSGVFYASEVRIDQSMGLPGVSPAWLLVYPRRWAGIAGLCGVALLAGLWIYCSLVPGLTVTGGTGFDEQPEPAPAKLKAGDVWINRDRPTDRQ